jgi:hypothetical protein
MAVVKLYDLARMTTATTGNGTLTLGLPVSPYLAFATAGVQDGDTVRYALYDPINGGSEIGTGVYTASGTTLTRVPTTSTNANAAIFLSGQAQVFITASANDFFPYAAAATGDLFYRNSGGGISRLGIGTAGQSLGIAAGIPKWGAASRTQLTTATNFYVNASASANVAGAGGSVPVGGGSDTTGDGTAAKPWQTLQFAYNYINDNIDIAGQSVFIFLAHGSSVNYALVAENGPWIGTSVVNITGDSSNIGAVTVVCPNGGNAFAVKDGATIGLSYLTIADSVSTNAVAYLSCGLGGYGHIDIDHCSFSVANASCVLFQTTYAGSISIVGPMTIHGAGIAVLVANTGVVDFGGSVVTVSGTPDYAICFAFIDNNGVINATSSTFVGSATGQKFQIFGNTTLGTFDPAAVFPGSTAGLTTLSNTLVAMTGGGLLLNQNATASSVANMPGGGIRILQADGAAFGFQVNGFGHDGLLTFVLADGTQASPTALVTGDEIGAILWKGWTGSTNSSARVILNGNAAENWSPTANGTYVSIYTTPKTTTTSTEAIRINGSGGLGIGTTSDPGTGLIYQNSASFLMRTKTSWNTGAGASTGTLTNAPSVGNPTKWIPIDDNGTTRYIPAW